MLAGAALNQELAKRYCCWLSRLAKRNGIAPNRRVCRYLTSGQVERCEGAVTLAVFSSALAGISFGYYPARKIAYLDPVEALRAE